MLHYNSSQAIHLLQTSGQWCNTRRCSRPLIVYLIDRHRMRPRVSKWPSLLMLHVHRPGEDMPSRRELPVDITVRLWKTPWSCNLFDSNLGFFKIYFFIYIYIYAKWNYSNEKRGYRVGARPHGPRPVPTANDADCPKMTGSTRSAPRFIRKF